MVSWLFPVGMFTCVFGVIVYLLVMRDFRGNPPVWVRAIFGVLFASASVLVVVSYFWRDG